MDILGVKAETWFPVVTLVIGLLLKGLFDLVSDKRRQAGEREARAEARRDMLDVRSAEFQRESLLQLQESAQALIRAAGRSHYEDRIAARVGLKWGSGPLSADVDQTSLDGQVRLTRYRVRIKDEAIRELAGIFSSATAERSIASSEEEAQAAMDRAAAAFVEMNEKIGVALRSLE